MKTGLLTTLVLLLTTNFAPAQELRIGAWNIEHLGSPGSRSDIGDNNLQDSRDIANLIIDADVDVLALSEIYDLQQGTALGNEVLDDVMDVLSQQQGNDWRYTLLRNRNPNDTSQLCGVAWNHARVQLQGQPFRVPLNTSNNQGFNAWDRHPHALKFSAGQNRTDFVLIPLHMKANETDNGVNLGRQQRIFEIGVLLQEMTTIRDQFDDSDIVLIGDSNVLQANEATVTQLENAGFVDLNSSDEPTFIDRRNGQYELTVPFDRAFVPENQAEFNNSPQVERWGLNDLADHRRYLSDHLLIVTSLNISADDD